MSIFKSNEEKRLKALCESLESKLADAISDKLELKAELGGMEREIDRLKMADRKREGDIKNAEELLNSIRGKLDKAVSDSEAVVFLASARLMDKIKNGGTKAEIEKLKLNKVRAEEQWKRLSDPQRQMANQGQQLGGLGFGASGSALGGLF